MSLLKNSLYSVIDVVTLFKGVPRNINNFSIRFPAKWSRYFEKEYEKENAAFISDHCKEGMTVIDIGAHLGLFSVIASKLVKGKGKVYAFEPTPGTFETLKKIIKLNNAKDIIFPIHKAVSYKNGSIDFYIDEHEGSNANSLVERNDRGRKSVKVGLTNLDDFVTENKLSRIDIVKIDAEGSELDVLRGGLKSFKKFRPKVILALHPPFIKLNNQDLETIYETVIELNYDIYFEGKIMAKPSFCSNSNLFDVHLIPRN